MSIDLADVAKQKKIQYFLISYVDLFGGLRAKLVPARAIGEMQKNGAGFWNRVSRARNSLDDFGPRSKWVRG